MKHEIEFEREAGKKGDERDWYGPGGSLICWRRLNVYFEIADEAERLWVTLHDRRVSGSVRIERKTCRVCGPGEGHFRIEVEGTEETLEDRFEDALIDFGLGLGRPIWATVEYE